MKAAGLAVAAFSSVSLRVAAWSCSPTYSAGPCFTSAKNWTEAQRTCEQHSSTLATINSADLNAQLGREGCFSDAPWNDWSCSWVGLTDLRTEGEMEWASGAAFSYAAWGQYEPDATAGNPQDCVAACHGGNISGYAGDFWLDLECGDEYAFCCDAATFVKDAGTPSDESFLNELAAADAAAVPDPPAVVDPDPYADRRLCFSTKQTWADAQTLCQSVGSNLITIHSPEELQHAGDTVHFSRVPDSWGLDWKCFWAGFNDQDVEGQYTWVSTKNPAFVPQFGPFEAGNGDGTDEDCVAVCQPDCDHKNSTQKCVDLGEYGYTGVFLIDAKCSDQYSFCCDGLAAAYVAKEEAGTTPQCKDEHADTVVALAVATGVAVLVALAAVCAACSSRGGAYRQNAKTMELSML